MNNPVDVRFFEKILSQTKDGEIVWERLLRKGVSASRSFVARTKDFSLGMWMSSGYHSQEEVVVSMSYDKTAESTRYSSECDDERLSEVIVRLFNYVYNQFPTAESVMEKYLRENQ